MTDTTKALPLAMALAALQSLHQVCLGMDLEQQDERPTEEQYLAAMASAAAVLNGAQATGQQGHPRCKTCKHWTEPTNPKARDICIPEDPDTGLPMQRGFQVQECRHPELTFHEAPVTADGFGLTDASNYFAALATAEGFGCVRHESRTRQQGPDAERIDITTIGDKEPRHIIVDQEGEQ